MYFSGDMLKKNPQTYLYGERKLYYSTGEIKEISNWNNGILHGVRQYFSKNGERLLYEKYINGKLVYMIDYELDDRPDSIS